MSTHSASYYMPREDLETLTGIKPIESAFIGYKRKMSYRHGDQVAQFDVPDKPWQEWLEWEAECCTKAFKK